MILGDFNADGAYVSNREMKNIRIRSDKNFHWLIGDDVDTTASNKNSHTYDRSMPTDTTKDGAEEKVVSSRLLKP